MPSIEKMRKNQSWEEYCFEEAPPEQHQFRKTTKQINDATKKFLSCKFRDGEWCKAMEHDVGVNNYSITWHCGNCKVWQKRK